MREMYASCLGVTVSSRMLDGAALERAWLRRESPEGIGKLLEGVLDGGGRRKGSAPVGEEWLFDGLVVKGTRAILRMVCGADSQH
jgi:hypothetical protein